MNYKISVLIIFLSVSIIPAIAQKATKPAAKKTSGTEAEPKEKGTLFFDYTSYNMGNVDEDKGKAYVDFPFVNLGKGDVRILEITTGCGCTSAEWDRGKVYKHGEKDHLTVYFNPKEQDGSFSKTIAVQTDGEPSITNLTIKGDVYGTTHNLTMQYPIEMGKLRFSQNFLNFPHLKRTKNDSIFLRIYNTSDKRIQITNVGSPQYTKTKVFFSKIDPKNFSAIMITVLPEKIKNFGPVEDKIVIYTDDKDMPEKKFLLKANVEEDFSILTPEILKNPPKIFFKETLKDFGEVYYGEVVEYDFEVTNKGKSDLYIRNAYGSCGCTVAKFSPEPIKKNKKGKITVRFDAKNLMGIQTKTITVISNDPHNPLSTLTIKASLVEDGMKKK